MEDDHKRPQIAEFASSAGRFSRYRFCARFGVGVSNCVYGQHSVAPAESVGPRFTKFCYYVPQL